MFTVFVVAAWSLDRELLLDEHSSIRLAIPPAICLAVKILAMLIAFPRSGGRSSRSLAPTLGIAMAYMVQSMLNQLALPALVLALGSGMSFFGISTLRLTFPNITDRLQAANAPAFWQKLELPPASLSGLKRALLPGGILLVVILYLLRR